MQNKIKELRKNEQLTLEYLSFVSGVSISYLNKLETGAKTNPSELVMKKIADALDKQVSDVFFEWFFEF